MSASPTQPNPQAAIFDMSLQDYPWLGGVPLSWRTFLDTSPQENEPDTAGVFIVPVPYDSTTSLKPGARYGPAAIIEASRHLEDYDIELDRDISEVGIHTTPELQARMDSPKAMIASVRAAIENVVSHDKLFALLGGEHTITIGAVQAITEVRSDISVVYIDAHADMRDSYQGTSWGHASAARRISEICPVTLLGVRSVSAEEMEFMKSQDIPTRFWFADSPTNLSDSIALISERLSKNVYISIDLDVLDPSIMSAVGTPEPGGMLWRELLTLVRAISRRANIVGFDIVELSPSEGPASCAFTAAKLAYKLIGYATSRA